MSQTMPSRYQLNEVSFSVQHNQATVPCIAVRWLGVSVGQSVGVAPHSPYAVTVGPNVTRWLNELNVNREPAEESARFRLRKPALEYMGATEGDRLVAERNGNEIVVRLVTEVADVSE